MADYYCAHCGVKLPGPLEGTIASQELFSDNQNGKRTRHSCSTTSSAAPSSALTGWLRRWCRAFSRDEINLAR
ncbi:MAG: hypothetical protein ABSG53_29250, partial [Thermoguttaceae bacterium]